MRMKHYLFEDIDGDMFIVGAFSTKEAKCQARHLFVEPEFVRELTEDEAENSGLDEY